MFGEVKNPFGLRNGKHITVNDLREDERGLACNCVCPLCKDPFEARLGAVRIHHFAHSGEGCDEIASYLMGLYGFFKDYASSSICKIPELFVYYQIDKRTNTPVTPFNHAEQITYYPLSGRDQRKILLSKEVKLSFDSVDIVIGKTKRPEAVIATYHGRRIAFVISPPDTVCKGFNAKPYKDIATLEIVLSKKADLISRANTEMMNTIFSDVSNYRWLSSPLVYSAFERINSERKDAYLAYQKEVEQIRIQKEEARRKQEELLRQEQELRQKQLRDRQNAAEAEQEKRRLAEVQREEDDRKLVEAQIKIPGQIVVDSRKRRWIQCETCGKIATDGEFWTYQWNRGQCKECGNKRIPLIKEPSGQPKTAKKANAETDVCPWCGSKLIKRNGRNGEFLGCSSYPKCRYSRNI